MAGDVREVERLIRDLGYEQVRHNGHMQYEHPDAGILTVSGSPSDHRWKANMVAELKRRHPEAFALQKADPDVRAARRAARRTTTPRVVTTTPLTDAERQAIRSRPSLADRLGITVVDAGRLVPNPGSQAAIDAGCLCAPFKNNRGRGVDGSNGADWLDGGTFEVLRGCPLHDDEPEVFTPPTNPEPTAADSRICQACGNPLSSKRGRGRPRKFCSSCRPSQWKGMTEEQRELQRARFRRWYHTTRKKAA